MKRSDALYYLLLFLLILGAFASMAQNSYGMKVIGGVAFVFSLVFMVDLVKMLHKPGPKDSYLIIELICLTILAFIFGLRVFYIHFPFIEWIFGAAAFVLALVFSRRMILRSRDIYPQNKFLGALTIIFHLGIIFFLLSLAIIPFSPKSSELSGVVGFIFLLVFLVASLLRRKELLGGEAVTGFSLVRKFRDHSRLIVSIFVLFSLYMGLNRAGIIPSIYSDEYPRAYFELVNDATSKKEKPVKGRYKYEEYMEKYKSFIRRNRNFRY